MTDQKALGDSPPRSSSPLSMDHQKESQDTIQEPIKGDERVYLTGSKLVIVIGGVVLVCFLVLLDTSIISTVSSTDAWPIFRPF